MDEQKRPRAWVYARIPGDYDGTMNSYKVCSMQALHDGCDIVGGSIDERGGWLLRPGYRDMMQQIKGGKVDRVYICRMRQISGKRPIYEKRLWQYRWNFVGGFLCRCPIPLPLRWTGWTPTFHPARNAKHWKKFGNCL